MSGTTATNTVAVTVHGSSGAVDLVVPQGAGVDDVAREYADQAGLSQPPLLLTSTGVRLSPTASLVSQQVESGDVLVATHQLLPPVPAKPTEPRVAGGGGTGGANLWFSVAAVLGVLAGVLSAHAGGEPRRVTAAVLATAAVIGVVPGGRYAAQRAMFAPAFAFAAAFAVAFEPGATRLPLVVGIAGLAAAVAAGVARALGEARIEVHTVWIHTGLGTFAVAAGGVLLGAAPQVSWALLLVAAMLAARFVPGMVIDVPDQLLIDLERLAVNAWSARDRTTGKRGRTVVPESSVQGLLARGSRLVDASSAAILVVTLVSVPALLLTATTGVDSVGGRALAFFSGAGLLLAARSYRHTVARVLLNLAGVYAWAVLAVGVLADAGTTSRLGVTFGALAVAACVVVAGIATGRGWRSVWWARRAEIGEVLCGALAVGSVVVATGLFRMLWE